MKEQDCSECGGSGNDLKDTFVYNDGRCPKCDGKGKMKEQVGIDKSKSCNCVCHSLLQRGCSYCPCRYGCITPAGLNVQMPQEEYDRLKRMNENVKTRIAKLRQEDSPCHDAQVELSTLESLDK